MSTMRILMMLCAAFLPAAALAATMEPVRRLSHAEVERVLAEAARKREAAEDAAPLPKRGIEGEVGVEVGTGGHRALYGTAFVPLGEEGGALVTFSSEQSRGHDRRRPGKDR